MSTPGKDEQGISFNIEVSALASIESIIVSMFVFVCVWNFKFKPALIFFFFLWALGVAQDVKTICFHLIEVVLNSRGNIYLFKCP